MLLYIPDLIIDGSKIFTLLVAPNIITLYCPEFNSSNCKINCDDNYFLKMIKNNKQ